jgi:RimJ/RimL family protein N-acetyltransferase
MSSEFEFTIKFMPLTQHWVPLVWPLIKNDTESIPKSWPKTEEELTSWALGTKRQQTIADRSIVLLQSGSDSDFSPVGLITGDLVRGVNADTFPGATYGDVNIAYMIFQPYRGKGIAHQALTQISRSWKEDGKNPILRIADDNEPSKSVAAKSGFVLREQHEDNGRILGLYTLS